MKAHSIQNRHCAPNVIAPPQRHCGHDTQPPLFFLISCFLIFTIAIPPILQAQDKITFQYDKAGNRISRTIVLAPRSAQVPERDEKQSVYTDELSDIKIKIYPNPTTGLLKVEIQNLSEKTKANIWIYAMSGKLISQYKNVSSAVSIDISNQPAGIYVMKITAGEHQAEWKIIKK